MKVAVDKWSFFRKEVVTSGLTVLKKQIYYSFKPLRAQLYCTKPLLAQLYCTVITEVHSTDQLWFARKLMWFANPYEHPYFVICGEVNCSEWSAHRKKLRTTYSITQSFGKISNWSFNLKNFTTMFLNFIFCKKEINREQLDH